ncbi:MAG: leucine-rich repeat domain-containing protein [Blautia sp.]|nr:leucine-rich repeat domain-containing protein [Blautia sp.]
MKPQSITSSRIRKSLFCLFFTLAICLLLARTEVRAAGNTVTISGTVYASKLKENAEVLLAADSSIVVDTDRTICYISGKDYSLSIVKGNTKHTLTIDPGRVKGESSPQWAIRVKTFATNASISITSSMYWIEYAILASGYVNIASGSSISIEHMSSGIISDSSIILNGNVTMTQAQIALAAMDIKITTGKFLASFTGKQPYCYIVHAHNTFTLNGGYVKVKGTDGLCADNGLYINGGTIIAESTHSNQCALQAKNGSIFITSGIVRATGSYGLYAKKGLEISRNAEVEATGSKWGIFCSSGEIKLYGKVTAQGNKNDGIYAAQNISVLNGKVDARGAKNALWSNKGTIKIQTPLGITTPPGGRTGLHNILDANSKDAKSVVIEPVKKISGSVSLSRSSWYVGETTKAAASSDVPSGTRRWKWQKSPSKTGTFTDISGAYKSDFTATDQEKGYYVRAVLAVDGYMGTLTSTPVQVTLMKPEITKQPVSATTVIGKAATFNLTAKNASSYTWLVYKQKQDGTYVSCSFDLLSAHASVNRGQTSNSPYLAITPKDTFLNGIYLKCKVTCKNGSTLESAKVRLTVNDCVTQQPVPVNVYLGNALTFQTSCINGTYYWWKVYEDAKGTTPLSWDEVKRHATVSGEYSSAVKIIPNGGNGLWLDGKYIGCSITLSLDIPVKTQIVKIGVWNPLTSQPSPASTKVGGSVSFSCYAVGAVSYKWRTFPAGSTEVFSYLKSNEHADVTGEESSTVTVKPKDTWLGNREIACRITLANDVVIETEHVKINVSEAAVTPTPAPGPSGKKPAAVGTRLQDSTGASYKVTSDDPTNPTVTYISPYASASGAVTIPESIVSTGVTYWVVSIEANAFKDNKKITEIGIGGKVRMIGNNAFRACINLHKITGGTGIQSIGYASFAQCPALESITLFTRVVKIGSSAFRGCTNLKRITIRSSKLTYEGIGSSAFAETSAKAMVRVPAGLLSPYRNLLISRGLTKQSSFQELS